ncbi:hypothetical protein KCP73_02735 [Salmonella enterica subsp. enterica]|nr:hypothetical protein KCP73_02735 [Salmonella enterica subsp. enterica]
MNGVHDTTPNSGLSVSVPSAVLSDICRGQGEYHAGRTHLPLYCGGEFCAGDDVFLEKHDSRTR